MTQVFSKLISSPSPSNIHCQEPQVSCALCLDAASKPIPPYEPNVSSLTGHALHSTDLVKPDNQGEFYCVTAGRQVGIVSNQSV